MKEIKYSKSSPDPENYWCSHQQSYHFFLTFVDFWLLSNNSGKPKLVDLKQKKLAVTGDFFFFRLSQKKIFLEPMEKILYVVNYW